MFHPIKKLFAIKRRNDIKHKNYKNYLKRKKQQPKKYTEDEDKLQNLSKKINTKIKTSISTKPNFSVDKVNNSLNQIRKKLKANPKMSRENIIENFYKAKWISHNIQDLPTSNSNPLLESVYPFDNYYAYNTENSQKIDATNISAEQLAEKILYTIIDINQDECNSIIYLVCKKIPVTQSSARDLGLKPGSFTPITIASTLFSNENSFDDCISSLRKQALNKHCNAIINIKITKKRGNDFEAGDREIYGDLIRIKNKKPIINIKKYGKNWKNNNQLLNQLEKESDY